MSKDILSHQPENVVTEAQPATRVRAPLIGGGSLDITVHKSPFSKANELEGVSEGIPERQPPPPYYSKLGEAAQSAIYDRLTGSTSLATLLGNSDTLGTLGMDMALLKLKKPGKFYPDMFDIANACITVGDKVANVFAQRRGETAYIIEPSLTPKHKKYKKAAQEVGTKLQNGELDPITVLDFAGPYSTITDNASQDLDEETVSQLRLYGGPSTDYAQRKDNDIAVDIACDSIRPDLIRVLYRDTQANSDMPDLLNALDTIKKGKGKRRHILNFESWASTNVPYKDGEITSEEAFQIFLRKVVKGDALIVVDEIKTHLNGKSRIYADVDNTNGRIPLVNANDIDTDFVSDVGATTFALYNLARNFLPELQHNDVALKFMNHIRAEIIEVNLNMIRHSAPDSAHAEPHELKMPDPKMKICRLTLYDLAKAWRRRRGIIKSFGEMDELDFDIYNLFNEPA